MKSYFKGIPILLIFSFLFGCNSPSEPISANEEEPLDPFMSLNIGDMTQYYVEADNLRLQNSMVDTVLRSDGTKMFVNEYSIFSTDGGLFIGTIYSFIRDGYYWTSEIDTVFEPYFNELNPFNEQKIINVFPKGTEHFLRIVGVPDSEKVYHNIDILDSLRIGIKTFYNVEKCELIQPDSSATQITLYYAEGFGHVKTIFKNENGEAEATATYIRIGDREVGQFVPLSPKIHGNSSKEKEKNSNTYLKLFEAFRL